MDDRELLELAAKAVGIEGGWGDRAMIGHDEVDMTGIWFIDDPEECAIWDPLTDDGDALRLANKLRMQIEHHARWAFVAVFAGKDFGVVKAEEPHEVDVDAATRRAIVRAAAEIGRTVVDRGKENKWPTNRVAWE